MRTYLLYDTNYLCHRAFHSTGQLSNYGDATGVLYGVLREIQQCRERFRGARHLFCFDHAKGMRELIYPGYKATRRTKTVSDEEMEAIQGMQQQVTGLKFKYLEQAGYGNVFFQSGFEADDIIAILASRLGDRHKCVIVSDDKDLYQLLNDNVCMYKPRSQLLYDAKQFRKDYGIEPSRWAKVKAIAGCSSDDVEGVPGVAEKTAVKYLRGELPPASAKYKAIKEHRALIKKNLPIVKLPLTVPGVIMKEFKVVKDTADAKKWDALVKTFGMETLTSDMPEGITRKPLLRKV